MATEEQFTPKSPALQTLIARGYYEACTDLAAVDELLAAGPVTFYNGYDATARSFHVGNLLTIMGLRVLQKHGHKPLCLIGGGTSRVGDPSGKTETRKLLDGAQIDENAAILRKQFEAFIHFEGTDHDAVMVDNADWLLDLNYVDFLREIGRHFTVNRMVAVKTYKDRLDNNQPLSFLEFNYQLLQAYDFLHLFRTAGCALQTGGADQWGNMVAGVELIRRVHADSDGEPAKGMAHCFTFPLITTADGKKMGKTERGAVWLNPDLLSPFDYFQFWLNTDDRDVAKLLRLYTELPLEEIDELTNVEGAAIREAKRRLALETTALLHGREEAEKADAGAKQAFGGGDDWSALPSISLDVPSISVVDLVVHPDVGAFKSKRQARQRIEGGAVKIGGEAVKDPNRLVTASDAAADGIHLQAGKKQRYRVQLAESDA